MAETHLTHIFFSITFFPHVAVIQLLSLRGGSQGLTGGERSLGRARILVPILRLRQVHKRKSIHRTVYHHAGFLDMLFIINLK